MTHQLRSAFLLTVTALLGTASALAADKTPGRIGAYLRLNEEAASPDALAGDIKAYGPSATGQSK